MEGELIVYQCVRFSRKFLLKEIFALASGYAPEAIPSALQRKLSAMNPYGGIQSIDNELKSVTFLPSSSIVKLPLPQSRATIAADILAGIATSDFNCAMALAFWKDSTQSRVRPLRFASLRLLAGVITELLELYKRGQCGFEPELIEKTLRELAYNYFGNSWLDPNFHVRVIYMQSIGFWVRQCPNLFWSAHAVHVLRLGMADLITSVRSEALKQARSIVYSFELSEKNPPSEWKDAVTAYALYAHRGGVARKLAIDILLRAKSRWKYNGLSKQILESCINCGEPVNIISQAIKLADIEYFTRSSMLLDLSIPLESVDLFSQALVSNRQAASWDDLKEAVNSIIHGQKAFHDNIIRQEEMLLEALVVLAPHVAPGRVYELLHSMTSDLKSLQTHHLRYPTRLLETLKVVDDGYRQHFRRLLLYAITLGLEQPVLAMSLHNLILSWSSLKLEAMLPVLQDYCPDTLVLPLAAWIPSSARGKYPLAELSSSLWTQLQLDIGPYERFHSLVELLESQIELYELEEICFVLGILVRVYSRLREILGEQRIVQLSGEVFENISSACKRQASFKDKDEVLFSLSMLRRLQAFEA